MLSVWSLPSSFRVCEGTVEYCFDPTTCPPGYTEGRAGDDRMLFVPVFFFGERDYIFFALFLFVVCNMLYYDRCYTMHNGGMEQNGFYKISVHLMACVEKGFFPFPGWCCGVTEVKQIEKAPLLNGWDFFPDSCAKNWTALDWMNRSLM